GDVDDPVGLEDRLVGYVGRGRSLPAQEGDGLDGRSLARVELVAQPEPLGQGVDGRRGRLAGTAAARPAQTEIGSVAEDLAREDFVAVHGNLLPPRLGATAECVQCIYLVSPISYADGHGDRPGRDLRG